MNNIICLEGINASGKSTLFSQLSSYFKKHNISLKTMHFPRYDTFWGKKIKEYLTGDYDVDTYTIALLFAMDRYYFKDTLQKWSKNNIVLLDRYYYSNLAFMKHDLSNKEYDKFKDWLEHLEFGKNEIPLPNLTLVLDLSADESLSRLDVKDKHENKNQQRIARKTYLEMARTKDEMEVINVSKKNKTEVFNKTLKMLKKHKIL